MDIKQTLAKLKALTASPNQHEADTAQRLYDKLKSKHNLTEADLTPPELEYLRSMGITITEQDGWTVAELDIHHANDQQIEASLEFMIRKALRKRNTQNEQKQIGETSVKECGLPKEEGK